MDVFECGRWLRLGVNGDFALRQSRGIRYVGLSRRVGWDAATCGKTWAATRCGRSEAFLE